MSDITKTIDEEKEIIIITTTTTITIIVKMGKVIYVSLEFNMKKLVFWYKKVNAAVFITVFRDKKIAFIKDRKDISAYWEEYKQKE